MTKLHIPSLAMMEKMLPLSRGGFVHQGCLLLVVKSSCQNNRFWLGNVLPMAAYQRSLTWTLFTSIPRPHCVFQRGINVTFPALQVLLLYCHSLVRRRRFGDGLSAPLRNCTTRVHCRMPPKIGDKERYRIEITSPP